MTRRGAVVRGRDRDASICNCSSGPLPNVGEYRKRAKLGSGREADAEPSLNLHEINSTGFTVVAVLLPSDPPKNTSPFLPR